VTPAELGLTDFRYFIERYLGLRLYECQERWADDFQRCIDGVELEPGVECEGYQLLAPADHGKTQFVLAPAVIWLLARDRNNRIGLPGPVDDFAIQTSRLCMSYIEKTPALARDYGLVKGNQWAVNAWSVARPDWRLRAPSVYAFGVGAEVQSLRFDYILGDDVATRRNSRTELQRAALRSYINTDLGSRLDKIEGKCKQIYTGHRVEPNDFYSDNLGRRGWLYRTDRAILDDGEKKVLAPEKWTYDQLCEIRSRDPIGFELLYQQQAAGTGRFITRTAMERVRVPTLKWLWAMTPDNRAQFRFTWLTLDPAFTTTRWSSYAVMKLWGQTHDGKLRLIWAWRERVTPETLLPMMEMKFRLYVPDHFFVEDNAAQTMLINHMRRKFPDHFSKFKGVTTINRDGSLDQEMIQLFDLFNREPPLVEIPYGGPTEQQFAHTMTEEFVSYPNGKSRDILMSTYIGLKGLGKLAQEERRGHVLQRGITESIAGRIRNRYRYRR